MIINFCCRFVNDLVSISNKNGFFQVHDVDFAKNSSTQHPKASNITIHQALQPYDFQYRVTLVNCTGTCTYSNNPFSDRSMSQLWRSFHLDLGRLKCIIISLVFIWSTNQILCFQAGFEPRKTAWYMKQGTMRNFWMRLKWPDCRSSDCDQLNYWNDTKNWSNLTHFKFDKKRSIPAKPYISMKIFF